MIVQNPFEQHTDADLISESAMRHPGYAIEAMRRLRIAVENQARASGRLTWAIIALMLVQIALAALQIRWR